MADRDVAGDREGKSVFVLGPEGSGSKLAARLCAEALGIHPFDAWDGDGLCLDAHNDVTHRSLPFGDPPRYPDVDGWLAERTQRDCYFVLTTRDETLSHCSRLARFPKSPAQCRSESALARERMAAVMRGDHPYLVWSYESFVFLGTEYLTELHRFLGVPGAPMPPVVDANAAKVGRGWVWKGLMTQAIGARYLRALRFKVGR